MSTPWLQTCESRSLSLSAQKCCISTHTTLLSLEGCYLFTSFLFELFEELTCLMEETLKSFITFSQLIMEMKSSRFPAPPENDASPSFYLCPSYPCSLPTGIPRSGGSLSTQGLVARSCILLPLGTMGTMGSRQLHEEY